MDLKRQMIKEMKGFRYNSKKKGYVSKNFGYSTSGERAIGDD